MQVFEDHQKLTFKELVTEVWQNIWQHEVLTRASAIAFSSMMASVPFLILALTAFFYLLPDLSAAGSLGIGNLTPEQVHSFLHAVFPPDVANVIAGQISHIQEQPPVAVLSISIFVLLWMSSTVFVDIMNALNVIYGVVETRPYWRLRLRAVLIMMIQLCIGLTAAIVILAWPQLLDLLHLSGDAAQHATVIKWIVIPITIMGSMAIVFRMGPASHQRSRWVTPGSLFGTVVFLAVTLAFREYVQNFAQYNRIYGSLGGVMALMFWFWLSSLVLLVAAEMNKVIEYAVTRAAKNSASQKSEKKNSGIITGGKGRNSVDSGNPGHENGDGLKTDGTAVTPVVPGNQAKTVAQPPAAINPADQPPQAKPAHEEATAQPDGSTTIEPTGSAPGASAEYENPAGGDTKGAPGA